MTVKEAAERLEVSVGTVYALVSAGKLKCHRVGLGRGTIRITEEHIAAMLGPGQPATPAPPAAPIAPARRPPPKLKHLR
jgi:excisionase family DNA binding protein